MSDENKTNLDQNVHQTSSIEKDIVYCSKCGLKNSSSSKYCSSCGNNLKNIEDSIKSAINNNQTYKKLVGFDANSTINASWDNKDMVDFIQKNPEYYIPKFEQIQKYGKSTSWNWASFFFGYMWFLYRKMYAYGFGLMALSFILSYIPFIGIVVALGLPILTGLFGNSIYLKHIEKNLQEVSNLNEDTRHRIIINKGGVNIALPIIIYVVIFILVLILEAVSALLLFSFY